MKQYALKRDELGNSSSLYLQVIDKFRLMIRDRIYSEGDKIASERELAEIFGVSRVPVREAMKVLEFLGVLQNIKGKGVFLRHFDLDRVLGNFDFLLTDPVKTLIDLFEVREALEIQAVLLASERRTESDLLNMEDAILEIKRDIHTGRETIISLLRFHKALFTAANNDILLRVYNHMSHLLYHSRKLTYRGKDHRTDVMAGHETILSCIRNRDGKGAEKAMREHLAIAMDALRDLQVREENI